MICYFSACFFFLFEAFVPEFSGIFLLGFVIPIFYLYESRIASIKQIEAENLNPFYFLVYLLIIASFLTICMPNDCLNYLACIFISYLANQISKVQKENPIVSVLLFIFTWLAIHLSLIESSGLAVLAFAFAIRAQRLKLIKIILLFSILVFLSFSLTNNSNYNQEDWASSVGNLFRRFQVDSILLIGCLLYFLVDWIRFFKNSSTSFFKTDFLFYLISYLSLFLLNEPIFSVFLFFSSLPMATKRKI